MGLLNETENDAANRFAMEHYERCKLDRVRVQLDAEATGIAFCITVKCPKCKAVSDITDYESW